MSQTDVLPASTAGANAGRPARSSVGAMQVLRWADKSRALAGSTSAALYQALWKHSQGPLAWTEAKGDSFKLAIFLPQ